MRTIQSGWLSGWTGVAASCAAVCGLAILTGCDKKYDLEFRPVSLPEPAVVEVRWAPQANIRQGEFTLSPTDRKARFELVVPEDELPGDVSYTASIAGKVVATERRRLDKDTKNPVIFNVDAALQGRTTFLQPGSSSTPPGRPLGGERTRRQYKDNDTTVIEDTGKSATESEPEMIVTPD